MATAKILVLLFAILVPSTIILAAPGSEEHSRHKRSLITCDFFNEAGFECISCNQTRFCGLFNIGIVTNCRGLLPYCRNGFCSSIQGSLCANSTSTTTTTTTEGPST